MEYGEAFNESISSNNLPWFMVVIFSGAHYSFCTISDVKHVSGVILKKCHAAIAQKSL
jgi:hypothetical protein